MYIKVENPLPENYRWASSDETELWTKHGEGTFVGELWVKAASDGETDFWDLALPTDDWPGWDEIKAADEEKFERETAFQRAGDVGRLYF
jgi:hypothetical protein